MHANELDIGSLVVQETDDTDITISSVKLTYLSGLKSNIQGQISALQVSRTKTWRGITSYVSNHPNYQYVDPCGVSHLFNRSNDDAPPQFDFDIPGNCNAFEVTYSYRLDIINFQYQGII